VDGLQGLDRPSLAVAGSARNTRHRRCGRQGGAGYGTRGNHGSVFEDLTADAVEPDDALVVYFGSRNDQGVDPTLLSILAWGTFQLARRTAPSAKFLVIGPPWPTADPPHAVLRIRDALKYQAGVVGATFIDPIATGWFVGRPDLIGQDGVHPTDAGHAYMADKLRPWSAHNCLDGSEPTPGSSKGLNARHPASRVSSRGVAVVIRPDRTGRCSSP